ncbi:hypothetical protein [Jatrophihabitans fulvus]
MVRPFTAHGLPEADDMATVCQGYSSRLSELADAHWALGRACNDYADHLDHCHSEIESELAWLAGESAGLQVLGAIGSIFSFGAAEAPTQVAQAARIAKAVVVIRGLIEKLRAAGRVVEDAIRAVKASAVKVYDELAVLVDAQVSYAKVRAVGALPALGRAGRSAAGGLARAGSKFKDLGAILRLSGSTPKYPWTTWANYPKVVRNGREYARIGNRLYTRHAVDRLQPRELTPGAVEGGRSVPPAFVEEVIKHGKRTVTRGPLGERRLAYDVDGLRVVTEGKIVVTVMRTRR